MKHRGKHILPHFYDISALNSNIYHRSDGVNDYLQDDKGEKEDARRKKIAQKTVSFGIEDLF